MPRKLKAVRKVPSRRARGEEWRPRADFPSSSEEEEPYFKSLAASTLYTENFSKRSIIAGRCIANPDLFRRHGFLDHFEAQGWIPILSLNLKVYPTLIRMFFSNFELDEPNVRVVSFLKGKHIILDPPTLAQILEIPNEGTASVVNRNWTEYPFTPLHQTQVVLEDMSLARPSRPPIRILPVLHRVLHLMITHNISPRDGHRDHVTFLDMCILTHLISRVRLNLPHLMMWQIIEAFKKKVSLPFGLVMTRIFQHFRVDLSDEEERPLRSPHEFYCEATLLKMHLRLHQGRYTRVEDIPISSSEEESEEEGGPSVLPQSEAGPSSVPHDSVPSGPATRTPASPPTGDHFRSGLQGGYRSIRQEIAELRQQTERRLDHLETEMQQGFSQIMDYLREKLS